MVVVQQGVRARRSARTGTSPSGRQASPTRTAARGCRKARCRARMNVQQATGHSAWKAAAPQASTSVAKARRSAKGSPRASTPLRTRRLQLQATPSLARAILSTLSVFMPAQSPGATASMHHLAFLTLVTKESKLKLAETVANACCAQATDLLSWGASSFATQRKRVALEAPRARCQTRLAPSKSEWYSRGLCCS